MLVCVMDGSKQVYEEIKNVTLTDAGVLSQCIHWKNVNRGVKPQYAANVAMKVRFCFKFYRM